MKKFNHEKFRKIREGRGISMQTAADHVQHNVSWLSSIETGRKVPNINDLLKLLDLYNASIDSVICTDQPDSYVKTLRMKKGWPREAVAEKLGCSVEDYDCFENKTKPLNMMQTLRLLEIYDIYPCDQAKVVNKVITEYLEANR